MTERRINLTLGAVRVHTDEPVGAADATAVLIQSGRVGPYDQQCQETVLYDRIAEKLVGSRIAVIRFDAEETPPRLEISDTDRIAIRTARLKEVLQFFRLDDVTRPLVFLGMSLGALSVCDVLSTQASSPVGAVLIGCVLEQPLTVMSPVRTIELLYGGRDHIAYLGVDGNLGSIKGPKEYASQTAAFFIVRPKTRICIRILDDLGHRLDVSGTHEPSDDAVALISSLLTSAALNIPPTQADLGVIL